MTGIKRTEADKWFSKSVRESFDYDCALCGVNLRHEPGRLDCSHIFSRKHRSVRWHPMNALSLCRSCHQKMADKPLVHAELVKKWWGEERYDELMLLHNQVKKIPKSEEKTISQHYRAEVKRLEEMRGAGWQGYLELENWEEGCGKD